MDRMAVGSLGALSLLLVALGCGGDDAPAVRDDMGFVFRDTGTDARRSDGQVDGGRDARTGDAAMRDGGGGRQCADLDECGDGVDGDCDGVVDQRCPCVPGDVRQCFRGDPTHRGLGSCRDGRMVCLGSLEFGTWGPCEDDVVEADEVCDGAGGDEDCDGAPNDGCECVEGDPDLPCGTSLGACERGFQRCVSGTRTECEGAVGPSAEICNGVDDDCDGTTDEDLTRPCGSDLGACRPGTETCRDGEWATCAGGVRESAEVCNGVDDDCDGMTDEGAGVDCGTDVGA
ncbi:MAG: hypothetical protein IT379_19660, partial [Deltaproteobacteria bacterium]|nr:hypothetical protein [Deltaproteobacteria bacterium]